MSVLACKIDLKVTFLGPGLTLVSPYLIIVDQIQVKLVLIQAHFGTLQSIVSLLDFPFTKLELSENQKKNY